MTGLVRKATLLGVCGVLVASAALAGVPSPGNSTIPTRINLVGFDFATSTPDGAALNATQTVTVRDLANNPISNSSVVLDFSGCTSDLRTSDGTAPVYATLTVNCTGHSVRALTNGSGVASFAVIGGGLSVVGPKHAVGCAKVFADGVLLGSIGVGIYDEDGAGGVGASDLSRFGSDFVGGTNPDRSDFDGNASVGASDLSAFGGVFVAGKSNSSAGAYCP
jgi:hypothetical protein